MPTLAQLTDEVMLNLMGYVEDQQQFTTQTGALTNVATTVTVTDGTQISTGLTEIDDELIWVSTVAGNTLTIVRGMFGSTAVAHSAGAVVRNAPHFPRFQIQRVINDVIRGVYPDLYSVTTTTLTSGALVTQGLPANCERVLTVDYQDVAATGMWLPITHYTVDLNANVAAYPTGKSISILDVIPTGRTLQLSYIKKPTVLAATTDDFAAVSGLQDSAKEAVIYGACARLTGYLEPAKWSTTSAEAKLLDGVQPAGVAINASKHFYAMHKQLVAEENRRLLERYPGRINWTR
jgi:hypothetical protein